MDQNSFFVTIFQWNIGIVDEKNIRQNDIFVPNLEIDKHDSTCTCVLKYPVPKHTTLKAQSGVWRRDRLICRMGLYECGVEGYSRWSGIVVWRGALVLSRPVVAGGAFFPVPVTHTPTPLPCRSRCDLACDSCTNTPSGIHRPKLSLHLEKFMELDDRWRWRYCRIIWHVCTHFGAISLYLRAWCASTGAATAGVAPERLSPRASPPPPALPPPRRASRDVRFSAL